MRASTAYFVGAGTIIAAIVIGLGGGIVAGNIMNPITPKLGPDTSKVAQRAEAAATTKTSNIPATTNAPGVPIDPNCDEVQQLKSAAMPLLFQLRDDQKEEVRKLARIIGLEKVAQQI